MTANACCLLIVLPPVERNLKCAAVQQNAMPVFVNTQVVMIYTWSTFNLPNPSGFVHKTLAFCALKQHCSPRVVLLYNYPPGSQAPVRVAEPETMSNLPPFCKKLLLTRLPSHCMLVFPISEQ